MATADYCFISAYLKGQEFRLVTSRHVDRMLRASTVSEVVASIEGTDLGDYLALLPGRSHKELDEQMWAYLRRCVSYLEWFRQCPEQIRTVLRAYLVKYDVANLKAALRGLLTGKKSQMVPIGTLQEGGFLDRLSGASNLDGIVDVLERGGLDEYAAELKERKALLGGSLRQRLEAEVALDRCYYNSLRRVTSRVDDAWWFAKVLGIMVDMANLQVICRAIIEGIGREAASFGITGGYMVPAEAVGEMASLNLRDMAARFDHTPYGTVVEELLRQYELERSVGVIEAVVEKHKFRLLREVMAPRVLSTLMVLWYLILKELEVRSIRIVLKAAADGLPLEDTRSYLVVM